MNINDPIRIQKINNCEWKVESNPSSTLKIVISDITKLSVDAIVNAANNAMLGGSRVDRATILYCFSEHDAMIYVEALNEKLSSSLHEDEVNG